MLLPAGPHWQAHVIRVTFSEPSHFIRTVINHCRNNVVVLRRARAARGLLGTCQGATGKALPWWKLGRRQLAKIFLLYKWNAVWILDTVFCYILYFTFNLGIIRVYVLTSPTLVPVKKMDDSQTIKIVLLNFSQCQGNLKKSGAVTEKNVLSAVTHRFTWFCLNEILKLGHLHQGKLYIYLSKCICHLWCLVRAAKHNVQDMIRKHSLQAGIKAERGPDVPRTFRVY